AEVGRVWNGRDFLHVNLFAVDQWKGATTYDGLAPSPPSEIGFSQCWVIALQVLPRLSLIRPGDGTQMPCTSCGSDVLPAFEPLRTANQVRFWPFSPVPEALTCPACSVALDPLGLDDVTPSGIIGATKPPSPRPYFKICLTLVTDERMPM